MRFFCCCKHCFPSLWNGNLKHFPLNSHLQFAFFLFLADVWLHRKLKNRNHESEPLQLPAVLIYKSTLICPFPFPPNRLQGESILLKRLPLLRTDSPGHYRSPKTTARSHPADLFLAHSRGFAYSTPLFLSPAPSDCSQREHAAHNWGHVTVLCKTFS